VRPVPPGFALVLDRSVRRYRDGHVLAGGTPLRVLRLTPAGRAAVDRLEAGAEASAAARALGGRLLDAGLAHPRPPHPAAAPDATVVVPVRNRAAALERCLAALDAGVPAVVVDDGSADPTAVEEACRRHGARVLRRPSGDGPAAARNHALATIGTELVAFLDSDCVPQPGWLAATAAHFADPLVGAVAPRVRPAGVERGHPTALDRYAAARSPLDMGPDESPVVPGGRVSYVPTAALVVRRRALHPPFDARLRYGEDVDLVWRLHDAGWRVRLEPRATVLHAEPRTWRALLVRRHRYGTAASPLARRHRGRTSHLVARPAPAAAAGLLLAGRPLAAALAGALQTVLVVRRLRRAGVPSAPAAAWSARALGGTLAGVGRAATMLGGPVLLAALRSRRRRAPALGLLVAAPLAEWVRRRPRLDPVRWTVACIADDIAYGTGVWRGCLAARTIAPLVPAFG
jgi:mycofactocin glycosyltransferase